MDRGSNFSNLRRVAFIIIFVALIAALIFLIIPKKRSLSDLERISLEQHSAKIANYLEKIDFNTETPDNNPNNPIINNIQLDRYVSFALEYSKDETGDKTQNAKELKKTIESLFDVEVEESSINGIGISPTFLNNNISYDYDKSEYFIENVKYTKRDIANIPINIYKLKTLDTGDQNNSYVAVFDKYTIKNPYDALSHINPDNSFNVNNYLDGKEDVLQFKKHISKDNISDFASYEKETTVTYTINREKFSSKPSSS